MSHYKYIHGVTASRFASQTRASQSCSKLCHAPHRSKKPRNPNTLIVTTKLPSPFRTPTLLSYLSSINRYTIPPPSISPSIISALFTTVHENLYIYIYIYACVIGEIDSNLVDREPVCRPLWNKDLLSDLIKRADRDSKFLSKGSRSGFKGFGRGRKEKEEMVFNPKTSH